jgi:hypothetical protein
MSRKPSQRPQQSRWPRACQRPYQRSPTPALERDRGASWSRPITRGGRHPWPGSASGRGRMQQPEHVPARRIVTLFPYCQRIRFGYTDI